MPSKSKWRKQKFPLKNAVRKGGKKRINKATDFHYLSQQPKMKSGGPCIR